jgi:small-conductance mechanosensitive channel
MTDFRGLLIGLFLSLCLIVPAAGLAQDLPNAAERLRQAEIEIDALSEQAAKPDLADTESALLRTKLAVSRQSAAAVADLLAGQLTALDARIAELGPVPAGTIEAPEVISQRAALTAERQSLDATIKRARLLDVEAEQLGEEMQRQEARQFGSRMARRDTSPLAPAFWGKVIKSFDEDLARIDRFLSNGRQQAQAQGQRRGVWFAILGVVLAIALLGPGRRAALRLGERRMAHDVPHQPMRRSAYAFWRILVGTIIPLLAAVTVTQGAALSQLFPPNWGPLLLAFIMGAALAASSWGCLARCSCASGRTGVWRPSAMALPRG